MLLSVQLPNDLCDSLWRRFLLGEVPLPDFARRAFVELGKFCRRGRTGDFRGCAAGILRFVTDGLAGIRRCVFVGEQCLKRRSRVRPGRRTLLSCFLRILSLNEGDRNYFRSLGFFFASLTFWLLNG